ncbi:MAG: hypothetical protein R6W90_05455 [Ignavibacteriaceae bacterium]
MKKIHILILTFVFFLSTTSLPVSLHMCKMMEDVSSEKCGMCDSGMGANENKDTAHFKNGFSSPCCSTQLIDTSVKDNFLNKSTSQDFNPVKILSIIPAEEISDITNIASYTDEDTLPPPLQSNVLYLFNSTFLI